MLILVYDIESPLRYTDFSNLPLMVQDLFRDLMVANWKINPYDFH